MIDDSGDSSVSVFVRDISLSPSGVNLFYIDTVAPRGVIEIQNNADFIKARNLIVKLTAYDATTNVASVVLKESMENEEGELEDKTTTVLQPMSSIKTFILSSGDGERYVQAIFSDAAGNTPSAAETADFFRTYLNVKAEVGGAAVQIEDGISYLWTAINGEDRAMYRDRDLWTDLTYNVSALSVHDGSLYVGSVTTAGKGILHRLEGESLAAVASFTDFDSQVSAMTSYGGFLYFALENKKLYVYDGTAVTLVTTLANRANAMFAEGKYLFIFEDLTTNITLFDGANFTIATVTDAYQQV
ncbi:MAG: hypothetical protein HC888_01360 [Candidatus Competibacteraceae bacterium]|nr:hypothetical protein [Candidatus Competibacteraceae bacterium]